MKKNYELTQEQMNEIVEARKEWKKIKVPTDVPQVKAKTMDEVVLQEKQVVALADKTLSLIERMSEQRNLKSSEVVHVKNNVLKMR